MKCVEMIFIQFGKIVQIRIKQHMCPMKIKYIHVCYYLICPMKIKYIHVCYYLICPMEIKYIHVCYYLICLETNKVKPQITNSHLCPCCFYLYWLS